MSKKPRTKPTRVSQLEDQLADAWRQVRELKAALDTRDRFGWDETSTVLLSRTYDTLARLEWDADPRKGQSWQEPVAGGGEEDPAPGAATGYARRRLYRFHRRLGALLRDIDAELEAEATGIKPALRSPRPYCPSCGRKGFEGDTVCGRGCGSLVPGRGVAA